MKTVKILSARTHGDAAVPVEIEVVADRGPGGLVVLGLEDLAARECRIRVLAAIRSAGFELPAQSIAVCVASPKHLAGLDAAALDLPIALGALIASGTLKLSSSVEVGQADLDKLLIVGELGLDGGVRPVRGVLPAAVLARALDRALVVPAGNAREAALPARARAWSAVDLRAVVAVLAGRARVPMVTPTRRRVIKIAAGGPDLADVAGLEEAKRALEVAAVGGLNVLLVGPPGCGKAMLGRRLAGILPAMTFDEACDITRTYSVAGMLNPDAPLVGVRPFRAPHHTVSTAGMIGGGPQQRPGEVALAHEGVLFLDELPEFRREVIEALSRAVKHGSVTVGGGADPVVYSARPLIVAAAHLCPCGFYGTGRPCRCAIAAIKRYQGRLREYADLLRLDIQVKLPFPTSRAGDQDRPPAGESSAVVRGRVVAGRARPGLLRIAPDARAELAKHPTLDRVSIVIVAEILARMAGVRHVDAGHVSEALCYRALDREEVK